MDAPKPPVREPLELLDRQWVFTQRRLLDDDEFIRVAGEHGVRLTRSDLEALHRRRLLEPLFGVRRDGREVANELRRGHPSPISTMRRRIDLLRLREKGRVFDPARAPFRARSRDRREAYGFPYAARWYVYSPFQVLCVPSALQCLRDQHGWFPREHGRIEAESNRRSAVALCALEPVMYPDVLRSYQSPDPDSSDYRTWLYSRPVPEIIEWLGVDVAWLEHQARMFSASADAVDPMKDWLDLVSEIDSRRWSELRGTARLALERRIASEMMLRASEEASGAAPVKHRPKRSSRRLLPAAHLDPVLGRFGISPHPRLVLIVEGAVELLLMPRVMAMLGMPQRDDLVQLVNRRGVNKPIDALLEHAAVPRLDERERDGWVSTRRPITRILIATDPEGKMSDGKREQEVQRWQRLILNRIDAPDIRAAMAERLIDDLLHVEIWDESGKSFEFVHFSDTEIATATAALDTRPPDDRPSIEVLTRAVAGLRKSDGNLQISLLDAAGTTKMKLAEQLWPVLEARIAEHIEAQTVESVPVARVLLYAWQLADEFPRSGLGYTLPPLGQHDPDKPRAVEGEDPS